MGVQDGRVAIVTGAASGIGRAAATCFIEAGGSVVAADREPRGFAWASGIERLSSIQADVTSEADNAAMVERACSEFGGLDALILNAGVSTLGGLDALPMEDFDRCLDVNLRGPVLGIRAALPALTASETAAIVITASTSGLAGDPGMWAYNAAKGGAVNLVRGAAVDLASKGIRVNGVCPGPVRTGMTAFIEDMAPAQYDEMRRHIPLQRWGEPAEVGEVICFLASPLASFVTGTLIPVDGGITSNTGQFTPPAML
jgi:meso-butanediol dehydrogenase/(S,S)-butanediol dehydrogenase/diacetyl reductase